MKACFQGVFILSDFRNSAYIRRAFFRISSVDGMTLSRGSVLALLSAFSFGAAIAMDSHEESPDVPRSKP